ncbi:hypothetical protein ACF0H5_023436 [Mactra antiquata]
MLNTVCTDANFEQIGINAEDPLDLSIVSQHAVCTDANFVQNEINAEYPLDLSIINKRECSLEQDAVKILSTVGKRSPTTHSGVSQHAVCTDANFVQNEINAEDPLDLSIINKRDFPLEQNAMKILSSVGKRSPTTHSGVSQHAVCTDAKSMLDESSEEFEFRFLPDLSTIEEEDAIGKWNNKAMGRGGQGVRKPSIPWSEIQKHTTKEDKWIVINGQVYDVTNWSYKHPGGSRLISHYAGQDATEAFGAFHNDEVQLKKYLKTLHVGSVERYEDDAMNKDFRELRDTAVKMGLFEPSYTFFVLILAHIIILEVLGYLILVWYGTAWWSVLASIILYSTAQAQTAWTQHDYGHLSVFKNSKIDHFFHHLTMGFIKAAAASWWNHMHYQHHAKPNIIDKDPDVRIDKLFVVGEVMPIHVAKTRKKSMPFNWQHRYFFVLGPPLLFPVYFQFMLFRHLITRKSWMELSIVIVSMSLFFYMMVPLLGVAGSVAYFFTVRCIESHWFTWVAQSNHIPMHIKNDEANPWLKLQIHATCDIEKSFFNDWFTGHLNFQIEHHLFPTMPRHNLYKIAPLVQSLCKKHNVPYIVKPLWQSFVDIVRTLKSSGELWEETYSQFHSE